METAGTGITVNSICPGPVKSLMNDKRIEYDAKRLGRNLEEHEQSLTPIGGRLVPEDIAPMAVYLASDDARMVTAQSFNICGGTGGTRFKPGDEWLDGEPYQSIGDICIFRYDIWHDISKVDESAKLDWSSERGRWTLIMPYN